MAKKSPKMSFEWIDNQTGIVQRLGFGAGLNEYFAQTLLDYAEPYTPMETGMLRASATVKANPMNAKIIYDGVNYADYQYNTQYDNYTTPGTTSAWLDYAWQVHKFEISGKVGARVRWKG
jgi:vacuolar-type H+-ATPase catalytic subunit A/Vma1